MEFTLKFADDIIGLEGKMRRKPEELDLEHQTLEGRGSFNMAGARVYPFSRGDSLWHAVLEAVWEEDGGPPPGPGTLSPFSPFES